MTSTIHSINIEFSDNSILTSLFGVNDINIQTLEKINNVRIEYRGNKVKIVGSKKSINDGYNSSIDDGLIIERKNYNIALNTKDRDEALDAFINKRKPSWSNE